MIELYHIWSLVDIKKTSIYLRPHLTFISNYVSILFALSTRDTIVQSIWICEIQSNNNNNQDNALHEDILVMSMQLCNNPKTY